ncbi:MAG: O-antigen ligase family protein, partial [Oligoflexia bacterium]|nr:O-antigen ligase family protein [Oligoflexia bacterium]
MASLALSDHGESSGRPTASGDGGRRDRRRRRRVLAWALSLLLPAAVLPFATVHIVPRLVLAGVAASFGAAAMILGGGRRGEHPGARIAVALGLAAGVVAGLSFLPLPASVRAGLQPGLAGPVSDALALTSHAGAARPLALDPAHGLVEWAIYLAMVLVVGGTAAVVRNRSRARRLATVVVLTGVSCVALGLVQRWTDASSILWWSGFPKHDDRAFFATFIDPNHAGVLMAAGAPLAVALMRDRVANARLLGALGVLLLLLGTLLSGSRGAAVLLALGVVVALSLSGGRRLRLALAVIVGLALAAVAFIGPQGILTWLTGALDPTQQASVAAGYGDVWGGRAELYRNVWDMVGVAPWLGVGPGGFDDAWRVMRTGAG